MKYPVFVAAIFLLLNSCSGPSEKTTDIPGTTQQNTASKNSDSFNQTFGNLLTSYYSLKDALVDYDTAAANAASLKIGSLADSLEKLQAGSDTLQQQATEAGKFTGTINGSSLALVGETDIQNKKKEFQMISDAMFDLARAVKYDQQKIYRLHCPMAFNDKDEAYWLSNSATIVNPYMGKKHPRYHSGMLGCGDVADSLGSE